MLRASGQSLRGSPRQSGPSSKVRAMKRLEKSIEQIGVTYDFKAKPKASDIFTDQYLPPVAQRKL